MGWLLQYWSESWNWKKKQSCSNINIQLWTRWFILISREKRTKRAVVIIISVRHDYVPKTTWRSWSRGSWYLLCIPSVSAYCKSTSPSSDSTRVWWTCALRRARQDGRGLTARTELEGKTGLVKIGKMGKETRCKSSDTIFC